MAALLAHQGSGSLIQCLNKLSYATEIECEPNDDHLITYFKLLTIQISLTEEGLLKYKEVIAIFYEYVQTILKSIEKDLTINFFKELKELHDQDYQLYNIIDGPEEHVCNIASAILESESPSQVLKKAYPTKYVFDDADYVEIKQVLQTLNDKTRCKIGLIGPDILSEKRMQAVLKS